MKNLHQMYNHYLHTDRLLDEETPERVQGYGWTDNGKTIDGYYVLTEGHILYYTLNDQLKSKQIRTGTREVSLDSKLAK